MFIQNFKMKKNLKLTHMKKVIEIAIAVVFLSIAFLGYFQNVSFAGNKEDEILITISSAEELWRFAKSGTWDFNTKVKLTQDIDLGCTKDKPWIPINLFYGSFDGNNHTISNLYIKVSKKYGENYGNNTYYGNFGLFSSIVGGGSIINTTIKNCTIEQDDSMVWEGLRIGVFAGTSDVKIQNCKTTGCKIKLNNCNVNRWAIVGGIVGEEIKNGTINNCISNTQISVLGGKYKKRNFSDTSDWNSYICGGIVGESNGTIKNCQNNGEITNNLGIVGGIVGGYQGENISYCKNNGKINVATKDHLSLSAGGIVGVSHDTYNKVELTINCCANSADIFGTGYKKNGKDDVSGMYLGGIIGQLGASADNKNNKYTITNCYSIGNISLDREYSKQKYYGGDILPRGYGLGGVIGCTMLNANDSMKISNIYSVGTIQNTAYAGAIFGRLITELYETIDIDTSNIYHTSALKDKGNENEKFQYRSLRKYRYIKDIKTNSTKKSIKDMKEQAFVSKINNGGNVFTYDKYGINKGYPDIKELQNGWKKVNGKKYYFKKGEYVTGLKKIDGKQYVFDKNGVLDEVAPKVTVQYSTKNNTKGNVKVTITANEKIQAIDGWTLSKNAKTLTKTYTANKQETIRIKDLTGNSITKTIKITNIKK